MVPAVPRQSRLTPDFLTHSSYAYEPMNAAIQG